MTNEVPEVIIDQSGGLSSAGEALLTLHPVPFIRDVLKGTLKTS